MEQQERRKHRRLKIHLPLEYAAREGEGEGLGRFRTITRNISTRGVFFEIEERRLREGQTIDLTLTVPPGTHFPYQGQVSTVAEITRVVPLDEPAEPNASTEAVASTETGQVNHPDQSASPTPRGRFGIGAKLDSWVLSF